MIVPMVTSSAPAVLSTGNAPVVRDPSKPHEYEDGTPRCLECVGKLLSAISDDGDSPRNLEWCVDVLPPPTTAAAKKVFDPAVEQPTTKKCTPSAAELVADPLLKAGAHTRHALSLIYSQNGNQDEDFDPQAELVAAPAATRSRHAHDLIPPSQYRPPNQVFVNIIPAKEEPVDMYKYKTLLCRFAIKSLNCPKGNRCTYAHSKTEQRTIEVVKKPKWCDYILENIICPFGKNCEFAHSEEELRKTKIKKCH